MRYKVYMRDKKYFITIKIQRTQKHLKIIKLGLKNI